MKITIIGYQFFEKELATSARSELVDVKALPKKKGDVTIYWQNYEEAILDKPTFWYMRSDKSMDSTMGKPKKFQVTVSNKEEGKIPPKGKL
jgi:hypothetical protein